MRSLAQRLKAEARSIQYNKELPVLNRYTGYLHIPNLKRAPKH